MVVRGDDAELEKAWVHLRAAVRECVSPCADVGCIEFMQLYSTVYSLCSPNPDSAPPDARPPSQAPALYARLRAELHAHTRAVAALVAEALSPTDAAPRARRRAAPAVLSSAAVLRASVPRSAAARYAALWDAYMAGVARVVALFSHLDRDWVCQNHLGPPIRAGPAGTDAPLIPILDLRSMALLAWRDELMAGVVPALVDRALADIAALRAARVRASALPPDAPAALALIKTLLSSVVTTGATALLRAELGGNSTCSSSDDDDGDGAGLRGSAAGAARAPLVASAPGDGSVFRFADIAVAPLMPLQSALSAFARDDDTALSSAEQPPDPLRATAADREPRVLRVYRALFERRFVRGAREFYARHSADVLDERGVPVRDYVRDVATAELRAELDFAACFVHESTRLPLRVALQRELVTVHRARLVATAGALLRDASEQGLALFRERGLPDLRALYKLLAAERGGAAPLLSDALRCRAEAAGGAALAAFKEHDGALHALLRAGAQAHEAAPSPAACFVHAAWRIFTTFQTIVESALDRDPGCQHALDLACEHFINAVDAAPQLLAQFIHELLERPALRAAALDGVVRACAPHDDDAKEWPLRAARLFRYLGDKAAFQRAYAERLARRLVFATSRARAQEHRVLALLADLCGADYTARLKRMFADVDSSASETVSFANSQPAFPLDVLVPSYTAWPFADTDGDRDVARVASAATVASASKVGSAAASRAAEAAAVRVARRRADADAFVALPGRIGVACAQFVQFYVDDADHARRRLTWVYGLCRVWVTAHDDAGRHAADLELTLAQTATVLYFNETQRATTAVLTSALGLPIQDVKAAAEALVNAHVLSSSAHSDNEAELVVAGVPGGGTRVVRVALVACKPSSVPSGARYRSRSCGDVDRRTQIQAAVVRVMKDHRALSDANLFSIVSELLVQGFVLDYTDLVHNVESLIESEYIERITDGYAYAA